VKEEKMSIFPTKVLLATDSSKESGLAAQTAADMAENTSSELHIVLVGLSVGYVGMGPPEIADIPAPRQEDLNEEAQRLLEAQVQQIEADGGAVAQAHLRAQKDGRQYLEGSSSTARRPYCARAKGKPSFWDRLFSTYPSWREEKVLEYIIHRISDGAHLRDVMQEQYVRRCASPDEVEEILENPRLVEAARKQMKNDLSSGSLNLKKLTKCIDAT
jgi:hypothetical protein